MVKKEISGLLDQHTDDILIRRELAQIGQGYVDQENPPAA